jgi:hypothetical protein
MGPKNPKWVFCVKAKDPLIVKSKKHIEIDNWDVEGRVSNQSCYRRSAYTNTLAEHQGKHVYFRDIFPSCLRDLSQLENIAKFLNGGYVVPKPTAVSSSALSNPVNFVVDVTGRSSMPGRGDHDVNPCAARKRKRSTWTRKRKRQTKEMKETSTTKTVGDAAVRDLVDASLQSKYPKTINDASLGKLNILHDPFYAANVLLDMKSSPPFPSPLPPQSLVPYPLTP